MYDYTIVNLVGDIFKYTGKFFGFIGNLFKTFFIFFYNSVEFIASIFGINNFVVKLIIAGIYMILLSLIPDFISFFTCRLSKKYRKLKTKEEKKEYCSEHIHFALKLFLTIKNNIVNFKSSMIAKKNNNKKDKKSKKRFNNNKNDVLVDDVVSNLSEEAVPVESTTPTSFVAPAEPSTPAIVAPTISSVPEFPTIPVAPIASEEKKVEEVKSNIKVLYSSNIIGNMLRKGVVLERKLLSDDRPVLIDFSDKPTEVFTGHLCDEQSGIKFRKMVNGKKIEMFIDNPELLSNPKLYDDLTKEELEKIKKMLLIDANYQISLKSFFITNDKALTHKKS